MRGFLLDWSNEGMVYVNSAFCTVSTVLIWGGYFFVDRSWKKIARWQVI